MIHWRPHHTHEVCHLTLVVTSFLTFGLFSVNDLPSGIMGKLSGALGELTQSYWVTAAPGGWVTTRIRIILRELDKNRNGSTQPQPEFHFLVRPQDHTLAVTQPNTIFPQRCIPSIRSITIFSTMRFLMALFMYECDNERQMEAVEQQTSSWEDDLNVGPIYRVWKGMGVCSTLRKHRNYAPAVWYIRQSHGWLLVNDDGEYEGDLNRPKGKKTQNISLYPDLSPR